jgi:hypothetical protein
MAQSARLKLSLAFVFALASSPLILTPAFAAEPEIYASGSFFGEKFGAGGYDPVAYFDAGTAQEGKAEFTTEWKGAKWRFASAENRDKFVAAPEKFAPQYGGYCAWAVSQGYTASGDPNIWKIVDGRLFLNYDQDVQTNWEKDIPGHIKAADGNWPAVLSK